MIDPLRYVPAERRKIVLYKTVHESVPCTVCDRGTKATFYCEMCKTSFQCSECFEKGHKTKDMAKRSRSHIIRRVYVGQGMKKRVLRRGDGENRPRVMDWVKVHYVARVKKNRSEVEALDLMMTEDAHKFSYNALRLAKLDRKAYEAIESTYLDRRPLMFQVGGAGPCYHLQVTECQGLASADMTGTSDPYVTVTWREKFTGATRVKYMNLNPRWTNESFVLPLEESFYRALNLVLYGRDIDLRQRVLNTYKRKARSTAPLLRLDVWDYDLTSAHDFLGQKLFSEYDLLRVAMAQNPFAHPRERLSFKLLPRQAQGKVGVRVFWDRLNRTILLKITDCADLDAADVLTNTSDPYCKVFWNNEFVGKSPVVMQNLNPKWGDAYFDIRIRQDCPPLSECTLRIEVFDWDKLSADDPLGQVELQGSQLIQFLSDHRLDYKGFEESVALKWEDKYELLWLLWQQHQMWKVRQREKTPHRQPPKPSADPTGQGAAADAPNPADVPQGQDIEGGGSGGTGAPADAATSSVLQPAAGELPVLDPAPSPPPSSTDTGPVATAPPPSPLPPPSSDAPPPPSSSATTKVEEGQRTEVEGSKEAAEATEAPPAAAGGGVPGGESTDRRGSEEGLQLPQKTERHLSFALPAPADDSTDKAAVNSPKSARNKQVTIVPPTDMEENAKARESGVRSEMEGSRKISFAADVSDHSDRRVTTSTEFLATNAFGKTESTPSDEAASQGDTAVGGVTAAGRTSEGKDPSQKQRPRATASALLKEQDTVALSTDLHVKVLYPQVIRKGYITRMYTEDRVLLLMDEDDYHFIGGDLILLSKESTMKSRVEGSLDFLPWPMTYDILAKLACACAEKDDRRGARIQTLPPPRWRTAEIVDLDYDQGLIMQYEDQPEEPVYLTLDEPLRLELKNADMDFQPWSFTYDLLERLFHLSTTATDSGGGGKDDGLSEADAIAARTIEIRTATGDYCTAIVVGHNPEIGLAVTLDTGDSTWITVGTPHSVKLMYTDLGCLPWNETYALLLRMWEMHEEYQLSMGMRVHYQAKWRPGFLASYDKYDGIQVVYDDDLEAALADSDDESSASGTRGSFATSKSSRKEFEELLKRLPKHILTEETPTPIEIEGFLDFLSWKDLVDILRRLFDHCRALPLDVDAETRRLMTEEEEQEMKKLKARVQVLFESHWRPGKLSAFDKDVGMTVAFEDTGTLLVTRDSPVMLRVENIADMDEDVRGPHKAGCLPWARPRAANKVAGAPATAAAAAPGHRKSKVAADQTIVQKLITMDDCILSQRKELGLYFLPDQSGSDMVKGTIGVSLVGHHRGSVLAGVNKAVQQMSLGEKARVNIRYSEGIGDMWGGEHVPPESDLEFDIELLQINKTGATLTIMIMSFFSALGCIGILIYKLLTGVDLSVGLDDGDDDVVGTVEEMDEHDDDGLGQETAQEEVDPEAERLLKEEQERLRSEEELRKRNRGSAVEARTLFSTPAIDMR